MYVGKLKYCHLSCYVADESMGELSDATNFDFMSPPENGDAHPSIMFQRSAKSTTYLCCKFDCHVPSNLLLHVFIGGIFFS